MEPSAIVLANMQRLRRVGGGLIKLAGKPMIEYVLDSIPDEVSDILITVDEGRRVEEFEELAEKYLARVVVSGRLEDARDQIEFAVREADGEKLLILPSDAPLITREFTSFLIEAAERFPAVLPRAPSRRITYLMASYQRKPLKEALEMNPSIDMDGLIKKIGGALYLSSNSLKIFDEKLHMFFRVSSRADVSRAEKLLRRRTF